MNAMLSSTQFFVIITLIILTGCSSQQPPADNSPVITELEARIDTLQTQQEQLREENEQLQKLNHELEDELALLTQDEPSTTPSTPQEPSNQQNETQVPGEEPVSIHVFQGTTSILFKAHFDEEQVLIPYSSYFMPRPWKIERVGDPEFRATITSQCTQPNRCHDNLCIHGGYGCVAGGPAPVCKKESSPVTFEWDKKELVLSSIDCGDRNITCSIPVKAQPGLYKVLFYYVTDCEEGESSYEKDLVFEQEFTVY